MESNDKLLYFSLGLGIGAAVALLVAAEPGQSLRGRIRRQANQAKDFVSEKATQSRDYLVDQYENTAKPLVTGNRDRAAEKLDEAVGSAVGSVRKAADQAASWSKDTAEKTGDYLEHQGKKLKTV